MNIQMCIYTCIYTYIYIQIYISLYIYISIYVSICIYISIYIYITNQLLSAATVVELWFISLLSLTALCNVVNRLSHVPYESVMSHMNASCPIWTSHIPYEWVMSNMNTSCFVWISSCNALFSVLTAMLCGSARSRYRLHSHLLTLSDLSNYYSDPNAVRNAFESILSTGWRRTIACLILKVIFC